jgi:hypothetical protein
VVTTLKRATELAAEPHDRPRFVFVHVMAPHPPLVIASDGSVDATGPGAVWDQADRSDGSSDDRRRRTVAQVQGIGKLAIDAIDELRRAAPDAAIVIFSDHGTDMRFDPSDPMTSDLDERTSVIVAASTPGHPGLFAPPVSPVNIVSRLAGAYAGADLPPRPDVSYGYRKSVLDLVPIPSAALGTP